jgi:hypothetical protein
MDLTAALTSFGPVGVMAALIWSITNRYMNAHQAQVVVTQDAQNKRIDALEKAAERCELHRQQLQEEIIEIYRAHPRLISN